MRALLSALVIGISLLAASVSSATETSLRIEGIGYVTDASHPNHPGDFRRYDLALKLTLLPQTGEGDMEISWEQNGQRQFDHYYYRRGRLFQVNDSLKEKSLEPMGDLAASSIAALHPALVAIALGERPSAHQQSTDSTALFAWDDELWTIHTYPHADQISRMTRDYYHDLYGDSREEFTYFGPSGQDDIDSVIVRSRERVIAQFAFGKPVADTLSRIPDGDRGKDRDYLIGDADILFVELAPHIFTIDLAPLNSRVVVAEFADHLMVIEGAFNSRVCDRLAEAIAKRFGKPVRQFAFSHLHGQYVGGVRSWISNGASIIVPKSTQPMIEEIASSQHTLRPDRLSRKPAELKVVAVDKEWKSADDLNSVVVYNVPSDHTDEYFIFYFPMQKTLITGDLLFYRPGKALTGRSKKLCETVAGLGIDVATYCATWPLQGYGTSNVVTRDEMAAACGK